MTAPTTKPTNKTMCTNDKPPALPSETYHEEGNQMFKTDKGLAMELFTKALMALDKEDVEEGVRDQRMAVLFSNRSACWMELNKPDLALTDGLKALEYRPKWYKPYYRAGCAYLALQWGKQAAEAFTTALQHLQPGSEQRPTIEAHLKQAATLTPPPYNISLQPTDYATRDIAVPTAYSHLFAVTPCAYGLGARSLLGIPSGTTILEETPLIAATLKDNTCAVCCRPLDESSWTTCPVCSEVLFCSKECEKLSWHVSRCKDGVITSKLELFKLEILVGGGKLSQCFAVVAAAVAKVVPELEEALMKLCRITDGPGVKVPLDEFPELHDVRYKQFKKVNEILGPDMNGNPPYDFQWYRELWTRVAANTFNISPDPSYEVCALLGTASYFNHSCDPNCALVVSPTSPKVAIKTLRDIPIGQPLTLSYVPPDLSKAERREQLLQGYNFHCTCTRCMCL